MNRTGFPASTEKRTLSVKRFIAMFVLLTSLIGCGSSATAGEKLTAIQTSLGNGTISGYVNSTAGGQVQLSQPEQDNWWHAFLRWFRFHSRP
jgi:acetate kinase